MLAKIPKWNLMLGIILIAEIIIFGLINPRFLNITILLNSFNDFIGIAIIAFFVTFVVITGGIDISGGSIIGLTSVVIGILSQVIGINIWVSIILAILVGGLCGLLNGILIAYGRVQAMVITLGGMLLYSGVAIVLVGFSGVSTYEGISGFPQAFTNLAYGKLLGIPHSVLLFFIMFAIAFVLLYWTRYGRYIYLTGINQHAAEYAGIHTRKIIASTYVLSGLSAGVAGVMLTSYLGSARADFGAEYLMPILTVVVLGGTLITGGKGGVVGTALASIIVGFLQIGLQMGGVSTQYIGLATGLLLIISAAFLGISADFKSNIKRIVSPQKNSV
ncbi:autoinducer 2 import system permease LsrD [Oceanobacillus sp. 143]|uniref:Autoinducer 2 import system permease protein LsrD n=1 Tax=Oceanobacillus zhaokaii TaxID=2052660 RepID=A0A345PJV6_9BACI|nr:autoinducer 2 import system permease LsrD [Oceanobacillus zhaokaii]AXI10286.1 autoinducer 2 import system permease LsrD [Oceanobacillus zhaokaii]QGS69341.1 autoinducer 2 import system permease LsrD [Oceanobacillus sp. 143]